MASKDNIRAWITLIVAAVAAAAAVAAVIVGRASYRVAANIADIVAREEVRAVKPIIYVPDDSWTFDIKPPGVHRRFKFGYISFNKLTNIGSGPATTLRVAMRISYQATLDRLPEGICENYMLFIDGRFDMDVGANVPERGNSDASYEGTFPWADRPEEGNNANLLNIAIEIYYNDIDGRRYRTTYNLWGNDRAQRGQTGTVLVGPDVKMSADGEITLVGADSTNISYDDEIPGLSRVDPTRDEFPPGTKIDQNWILHPCDNDNANH